MSGTKYVVGKYNGFEDNVLYRVNYWRKNRVRISMSNDFGDAYTQAGTSKMIRIVEDKNGYTVTLGDKEFQLDYSEAEEVFVLLKLISKKQKYKTEFSIVETVEENI